MKIEDSARSENDAHLTTNLCPNCGHDQDGAAPTHCLSCQWPLQQPQPKPPTLSWLWPDHVIGKRESRRLRDEHNALVNRFVLVLAVLKQADKGEHTPVGEEGPCRCSQCEWRRTAVATIAKVEAQ